MEENNEKKVSRACIMIVEDELIVAQNLQNLLFKLGYDVCGIVNSGQKAIRKAEELRPDLVLMDIKLSGSMDGIDAADQIYSRFQVPVVYLTAYADDETLQRAKTTDPFGYILKPFELKKLHSTIEIALYKHQMEKKLKESERRFRTLADSSPVGIFETDADGDCIYVNRRWCQIAGLSPGEAMGRGWARGLHPDDRGRISAAWYEMVRSGSVFEEEYRFQTPPGQISWVFSHTAALTDDAGNITGYIGTITDITVRKKLEEELLTNQKLESIGILAGGIAHDFNNLLSVIMGTISVVKEDSNITEGQRLMLESVERASNQASDLAQKLITFSNGGWLSRKKVYVNHILEEVIQRDFAGKYTSFDLVVRPNLTPVDGDESKLKQVFHNLLINALEAGGGDKGITITLGNEDIPEEKADVPLRKGAYVKVAIQDRGMGISRDNLAKVFDPYFTTKEKSSKKGLGLGMTICYSIIRKHNGHITVKSREGEGTTVEVYLPTTPPVEDQAPQEPPANVPKKRVLMMDDDPIVQDVTTQMLTRLGLEVAVVEEGGQAVELYRQSMTGGKCFDIVFLDLVNEKGMGGRDTLRRLLEINPGLISVAVSGFSHEAESAGLKEDGFSDVLFKPYKLADLKKLLAQFDLV
jgi:PAS domain S-box-containing protein